MTALALQVRRANDRLRAAREAHSVRDAALVAVRVGLAWVFVYTGSRTLFGAFGGPGVHGQAEFFAHVAHLQPATFFAVFGGLIEFFGGIAVGLGILGRLAALGLFGDMVVAMATVTFRNGVASNAAGGGYGLNVALAALAVAVVLMGTGRFSIDAGAGALVRRWRHPR
jgi:putative oxidoreductase